MANKILFTDKHSGEQKIYSSLKPLFENETLPIKYDRMAYYMREEGKFEDNNIKIERKTEIK